MSTRRLLVALAVSATVLPAAPVALAQALPPVVIPSPPRPPRLTPDQMDQLTAPIALYPDPLLAQVLLASTHPYDVLAASQWLRSNPNPTDQLVATQPWDPSVQSLVFYPTALQLLANHLTWTRQLGRAYTTQPADLNQSVQRLRARARAAGSLATTPEQNVVTDNNNDINILPCNDDTIYVPTYDPAITYTHRHPPHFDKPHSSHHLPGSHGHHGDHSGDDGDHTPTPPPARGGDNPSPTNATFQQGPTPATVNPNTPRQSFQYKNDPRRPGMHISGSTPSPARSVPTPAPEAPIFRGEPAATSTPTLPDPTPAPVYNEPSQPAAAPAAQPDPPQPAPSAADSPHSEPSQPAVRSYSGRPN